MENENHYLCECNNCFTLMFDENPQVNTEGVDIDTLDIVIENMVIGSDDKWVCPKCETDAYLKDYTLPKKCNHTIGLASINDEEDEFVEVCEGDGIDFSAGSNKAFKFCPKCGEEIIHELTDTEKAKKIADIMYHNREDYKSNMIDIITNHLTNNKTALIDYVEWFKL